MKLQITPEAKNDLAEIKKYIRDKLSNPIAANRIVGKIVGAYKQLKTSPYIGTQLDSITDRKSNYRFWVCGNYLIFYLVNDTTISINRIVYGKRDYCKLLFNIRLEEDQE